MRVVVIEDEDKARQLIIRLLRQADPGIQVVGEAANGDEGRALVLKQLPDLAFVDIKMPGMSGLNMIRSLQSKKMQVNYVIISGYGEFHYAQEAIELGIKGYILKPVSYGDIERAVNKAYTTLGGYSVPREVKQAVKVAAVEELLADIDTKKSMVRNAVNYVRKNISARCRLSDAADNLRVSPEYLSRIFHEEMKITFMAFVKKVKIEHACVLLRKTDLKVYEIAAVTGYDNDKYFCNIFREVMGMSPKKYREQYVETILRGEGHEE